MGNFSEGFFDLFIVVCTLGGIFGLYLFVLRWSGPIDGGPAKTTGHRWDEDLEELNNPLPRWWLNLFFITLAFGVVYLFLYPGLGSNRMVLGWTQIDQYQEEVRRAEARYGPLFEQFRSAPLAELATDPAALRVGERLFATYCTSCHGSDASGARGFPNLVDEDWLYGGAPETIETTILDGRNGVMPGWRAALGGDQGVREVAHYVLGLAGREHDASLAAAGKPRFEQICVACHLADGTGNPQLGAPKLTDDVWLYGGSMEEIEASIGEGRQGVMPPHRELLGEAKVHVLAAYVYSLSR